MFKAVRDFLSVLVFVPLILMATVGVFLMPAGVMVFDHPESLNIYSAYVVLYMMILCAPISWLILIISFFTPNHFLKKWFWLVWVFLLFYAIVFAGFSVWVNIQMKHV